MIEQFITVLAWLFLILACIKFVNLVLFIAKNRALVALAEASGQNPIGATGLKTIIVIIVCATWIIVRWLH